jgi:hypothetical protein
MSRVVQNTEEYPDSARFPNWVATINSSFLESLGLNKYTSKNQHSSSPDQIIYLTVRLNVAVYPNCYLIVTMDQSINHHELISPFNMIFSCVICQRTIADVYPVKRSKPHHETGSLETPCKMWLTNCSHLTCSDHLEGGGKSLL